MPVRALPIDLQLELRQIQWPLRAGSRRRLVGRAPLVIAAALICAGLIHALAGDRVGAFESPFRFGSLLGGALLWAVHAARTRSQGFRADKGQQLVLGPASVVVVDAQNIRVIPAEELSFSGEKLKYGDELLYDALPDHSRWPARAREVIRRAASMARKDRYRDAVKRLRPISPGAQWWSQRRAQILAAGAGICAAVFVEAGPVHQRALAGYARQAKAAEILANRDALDDLRARAVTATAAVLREESDRKERQRRFAAVKGGSIGEMRSLLSNYPTAPERPRAVARLEELCALKAVPLRPGDSPKTRLLRAMIYAACASADGEVHYEVTGDAGDDLAKKVLDGLFTDVRRLPSGEGLHATPGASGNPYVRVALAKSGGAPPTWTVEVTAIDAAGQQVPDAVFTTTSAKLGGR